MRKRTQGSSSGPTRPCIVCGRDFEPLQDYILSCYACTILMGRRGLREHSPTGFDDPTFLRKVLQLTHPDKHNGSALATNVTAAILKLLRRAA